MAADAREIAAIVHRLVDDYRDRCLWFLRCDYYPEEHEQILHALDGQRLRFHAGAIRGALPRVVADS